MAITYPLSVYYDASCRLCNSEMQNIKLHDINNQLILIDCSAPDFDDNVCKINNINLEDMMIRLHVQDAQGKWLIGVTAFELIYQTIGMDFVAKIWRLPITRIWLYPFIAKHRNALSKLGVPQLFDLTLKFMAKRAEKRSRLCSEGRCSINDLK
ncbi:thiol-disulfide oxidoreductase DCC family protein [Crenothrix sp.]|uniref:thiol-disulfide oxidoreductase DCC family protein n=1 Tax=Crenothrix sp. TaxID=3100433 RepID=UPI00374CC4E6